jgi:hypothetical protein
MVHVYVEQKERSQADCKNDPLFRPIAVTSATRKLEEIKKLPSGKGDNADIRPRDRSVATPYFRTVRRPPSFSG